MPVITDSAGLRQNRAVCRDKGQRTRPWKLLAPRPPSASEFFALSAVFALPTAGPGARCVTTLFAMFFAFFLVMNPPATAVPPSAAMSATMATIIAGDGRRITLLYLPVSPSPDPTSGSPSPYPIGAR